MKPFVKCERCPDCYILYKEEYITRKERAVTGKPEKFMYNGVTPKFKKLPALSTEQEKFVQEALKGNNILVDACIGSGKTTAIQALCNRIPGNKKVLYLTYSKLLKLDAQARITADNTKVINYHGFAYSRFYANNRNASQAPGVSSIIGHVVSQKYDMGRYDVLVIDEYQDIDESHSEMLDLIKTQNPGLQIVAVGDMCQKVRDYTTLDVMAFMTEFLGKHLLMEFTKCFRLSEAHAKNLGYVWGKTIRGVNPKCHISRMDQTEIVKFLSQQPPEKILCLGRKEYGDLSEVLNILETKYPEKFNKKTVYASIRDQDESVSVKPNEDCAIFTSYDSCKGLERDICVLFDFTDKYWDSRLNQHGTSYEILRNIFLVAASRGKYEVIFAEPEKGEPLTWETIKRSHDVDNGLMDEAMSDMFDFKYKEDVDKCYSLLDVTEIQRDNTVIDIPDHDELIDLSPCIGIFQQTSYFKGCDIDDMIKAFFTDNPDKKLKLIDMSDWTLTDKILYLTALTTGQARYRIQADKSFVSMENEDKLADRLSELFDGNEDVEVECALAFAAGDKKKTAMLAKGRADVVKDDKVYELKFTSTVRKEHFLQLASYMLALGKKDGVLWNTKDNSMFEVRIPDRNAFINSVAKCVTKETLVRYYIPSDEAAPPGCTEPELTVSARKLLDEDKKNAPKRKKQRKLQEREDMEKAKEEAFSIEVRMRALREEESAGSGGSAKAPTQTPANTAPASSPVAAPGATKIAVIDTETNWDNKVMSIGLAVMNAYDDHIDMPKLSDMKLYYHIVWPASEKGGVFARQLKYGCTSTASPETEQEAIAAVLRELKANGVTELFAYNATFDKGHLTWLSGYKWYDIMKIAAYRQYNSAIDGTGKACHASGKLKSGYSVESIIRMLAGKDSMYREVHNALYDARDEAFMMAKLGHGLSLYRKVAGI